MAAKLDLVSYASLLIMVLYGALHSLVAARRYKGRFVRPGLRLLFAAWAVLLVARFAGVRLEVETELSSALLFAPTAILLVAMFYFSAEAAFRETWGAPDPELPEPVSGQQDGKEALK